MSTEAMQANEVRARCSAKAEGHDVPPGYQRTHLGVIPEDWFEAALGDVADLQNGYAFQSSTYIPDGAHRIITIANVQDGHLSLLTCNTINELPRDLQGHQLLSYGDLLISMTGNVGRVCIVQEAHCLLNQRVGKLVPRRIDRGFLYYIVHDRRFLHSMIEKAVGGAQGNLGKSDITGYLCVLPRSASEQRAIAGALSDVDALIAALDRLIAKKRAIKLATMQQLLTGRSRLPGFAGEWEIKSVSDFGDIVTGGTPRTDVDAFWGEEYPWITPTDITSHRDMYRSERMITQDGLNSIRALPANTMLVTCIASIGKNAILRTRGGCNQQINAVLPNIHHNADFLYYLFTIHTQYLLSSAGMTATSIVSKKTFSELTFKVPPLREQTAIAAVLSDMDAEITALERRRDKTKAIKQGMMQELLTGRVRLI